MKMLKETLLSMINRDLFPAMEDFIQNRLNDIKGNADSMSFTDIEGNEYSIDRESGSWSQQEGQREYATLLKTSTDGFEKILFEDEAIC